MNRYAATNPTALAKAFSKAATESLTTLCPISGLKVFNDLPPYPGAVFSGSIHPIVVEAPNLVLLGDSYLAALSNEQLSGLLLALLNYHNKLDLQGPAFLIRAKIETTLTGAQLLIFIKWLANAMAKTKRCYPKLELAAKEIDETTFDKYMKNCAEIERFYSEIDSLVESMKKKVEVDAPSFLSTSGQAKALNKAVWEAFKELAPCLPKVLVDKLKPFAKDLATTSSLSLVDKIVVAISKATGLDEPLLDGTDDVEAAKDFLAVLESKRKDAKELGLEEQDIFSISVEEAPTAIKAIKTVKLEYFKDEAGLGLVDASEKEEAMAPTGKVAILAVPKLSFAEKLAALKGDKQ